MSLRPYLFFFASAVDGLHGLAVVHGQHAAKGVGAKMLDEGVQELVAVLEQQSFEMDGILERTAVGHHAGGIDRGVLHRGPAATFSRVRHCPMAS